MHCLILSQCKDSRAGLICLCIGLVEYLVGCSKVSCSSQAWSARWRWQWYWLFWDRDIVRCVGVKLAAGVRSLGVRDNNTLSFGEHVDSVCGSSHFRLGALRHIRRHITADTTGTIACLWSTGDLTAAALCFTARRPWASASCRWFGVLLLISSPDLDALGTRCPCSLGCIGCQSGAEYIARSPLQHSGSWQHGSRAALPTSSGFMLLRANFGPAEGICCAVIVLA